MISFENLIPERCLSRALEIYFLITSITSKTIKGERKQPCLKPLELLKKDVGEPLIKTAKLADASHYPVHNMFSNTNLKKYQTQEIPIDFIVGLS